MGLSSPSQTLTTFCKGAFDTLVGKYCNGLPKEKVPHSCHQRGLVDVYLEHTASYSESMGLRWLFCRDLHQMNWSSMIAQLHQWCVCIWSHLHNQPLKESSVNFNTVSILYQERLWVVVDLIGVNPGGLGWSQPQILRWEELQGGVVRWVMKYYYVL